MEISLRFRLNSIKVIALIILRMTQQLCCHGMGHLPDTYNYGLRMHRECRERFPRHWLQMKPLVSDPGMHYGTCRDVCQDRWPTVAGKTFPAFPAHAKPAILFIW